MRGAYFSRGYSLISTVPNGLEMGNFGKLSPHTEYLSESGT